MSGKPKEDAIELLKAGYSEANAARMISRTYGLRINEARDIVASVKAGMKQAA